MKEITKLILKTIAFSLTLPLFFALILPLIILFYLNFYTFEIFFFNYLGIILIIIGIAIYSISCYYFIFYGKGTPSPLDEPKMLITEGIYKYTRNPMYLSGVLIVLGEAIFFESLMILAYTFLLFVIYHLFIVFYEEPHLIRKYGKLYEEYMKRTPRWLGIKRNNKL
jgi:protein-S-isoprenylcysteine O-methyltransferase Ste14